MIKVLYIVSTLRRRGPTFQLLNIIKNLDSNIFDATVLTLSPEYKETCIEEYKKIGIKCISLNLGRIEGIFFALPKLIRYLKKIKPNIIHSQGIRSDLLSLFVDNYCHNRVITLRNFALEDYKDLYGIIGVLMAKLHWFIARRNNNVVACSEKLSERLDKQGIKSIGISNGIDVTKFKPNVDNYRKFNFVRPLFIVSGHLINRKNNLCLVEFFNKYFDSNKGTLFFIGNGEEKEYLENLANKTNIQFLGRVTNPVFYLQQADVIISASKSEGLPNSILEGLSCGLPALLSNITSHLEIKEKMPDEVFLFDINSENDLSEKLSQALEFLGKTSKKEVSDKLRDNFSAEIMSKKYQSLYLKILGRK